MGARCNSGHCEAAPVGGADRDRPGAASGCCEGHGAAWGAPSTPSTLCEYSEYPIPTCRSVWLLRSACGCCTSSATSSTCRSCRSVNTSYLCCRPQQQPNNSAESVRPPVRAPTPTYRTPASPRRTASPGADVAAGPGPMCGAFGEAPTTNEAVGGDADQRGGFAPCCVEKPGRVSLTEAGVLQGTSGGTAGYSGEVVKEKARTTSGCRSMRKRNRSPRSLFVCCA